jgi:hypothetical protein
MIDMRPIEQTDPEIADLARHVDSLTEKMIIVRGIEVTPLLQPAAGH